MSNWQVALAVAAMITATITVLGAVVAFGRWTGKVDKSLLEFGEFMKEIRADIKNIFKLMPPKPVAGNSPLKLTELGERMAAFMNAPGWAEARAPALLAQIAGMQDFEVDDLSRNQVRQQHDHDQQFRNLVASCAYEFGTPPDGALDVLQVVLRDELLRLRGQQ